MSRSDVDICRPRAPTGEIRIFGNRYWAPELHGLIGVELIVRYDPNDLQAAVQVWDFGGKLVCEAQCIDKAGFDSEAAVERHAQQRRAYIRWLREAPCREAQATPALAEMFRAAFQAHREERAPE